MKNQKVICYGASSGFERLYYGIHAIYDVVGVSDKNPEKKAIAEKYGVRYILPEQLEKEEFDYIVITSCYEEAIKNYLVTEIGIPESKIIGYTEFLSEQKCSLGTKNPDKQIYILRRMETNNGINILLLEYLYQLMHCGDLERYEVVMDAQNYPGLYHTEENRGKQNIIEYYFNNLSGISVEDAYQSENVLVSRAAMLNENVVKITKMQRDICKEEKVRSQYRALYYKYFHLNEKMQSYIDEQVERYIEKYHRQGKKICGIVDRTKGYNNLKTYAHYMQPEIDYSFKKISELREKWGFDIILLDTPFQDIKQTYENYFGDCLICTERSTVETKVVEEKKRVWENRENDEFFQGKELLASRYVLAQCDYFYSGISGSSTFPALLGNFEKMYIYENGRFGLEDEK